MSATDEKGSEATYRLREAMTVEGPDLAVGHPWFWEVARWRELVFALLTRTLSHNEAFVQEIAARMFAVGLLDVDELAGVEDISASRASARMVELLQRAGVDEAERNAAVTTIVEAARGLTRNHGGKVQLYLRHYGELMLSEIDDTFSFSQMEPAAVREAFVYWLQNVLNMPLPLTDTSVMAFCDEYGLTSSELYNAADEMGMSFNLVDDLAHAHIARQAIDLTAEDEE